MQFLDDHKLLHNLGDFHAGHFCLHERVLLCFASYFLADNLPRQRKNFGKSDELPVFLVEAKKAIA